MIAGPHDEDRGLGGVERVRGAREQDSRISLAAALSAHAAEAAAVHAYRALMSTRPQFTQGSPGDFHADRAAAAALAQGYDERRQQAENSLAAAEEARERWQQDRTRLRAVQMLLERRAAVRRAERERRETAELDDLAAQGWLRRRTSGHKSKTPREDDR